MKIKLKIIYGPDYERCKTTVVTKELSSMTLYELSNMVSKVVGGFFDGENKLRLQYRDDERTYVTMNKQTDISDAAHLSSLIPQNDELLRVYLRVDNDFMPTSQHHEAPAKKRQCKLSESKRQLNFPKNTSSIYHLIQMFLELIESEPKKAEEEPSSAASCSNREFQSPIQRYFKKIESELESKKQSFDNKKPNMKRYKIDFLQFSQLQAMRTCAVVAVPPKHKLSEILSSALNERQTNMTSSCTTNIK